MEFFHDECRCPVYVRDVVKIILALTNRWLSGNNLVSMLLLKAEISGKLREDSSGFFFYMVLQLVFLVKKLVTEKISIMLSRGMVVVDIRGYSTFYCIVVG